MTGGPAGAGGFVVVVAGATVVDVAAVVGVVSTVVGVASTSVLAGAVVDGRVRAVAVVEVASSAASALSMEVDDAASAATWVSVCSGDWSRVTTKPIATRAVERIRARTARCIDAPS
jgi:hypothetical protein